MRVYVKCGIIAISEMEDGTMLISEDADIDRAREEEAKHTGGFSPFGHGNTQAPFRGVRAAAGLPPAPVFKAGDIAPSVAAFGSSKNVGHGHVPESNLQRPDRNMPVATLGPPYLIARTTADTLELIIAEIPTRADQRRALQIAAVVLREIAK